MMKKKEKILLVLILLLAAALRLWGLNHYPVGLNADEAAIGYNAYSLIETGLDEHGNAWPIHFKSFGDYKPGFYFYLALPFVKVLGLNVWAVRLPSALLGIFSVLLIYLLVRELFANRKLALISAFFLSISPWHLHFSRGGWEANAATFFILLGVYLFFKGLKKPRFFLFSALACVLSLYTYHSARVVVPLLGLGLVFLYRQMLFSLKNRRWLIISGIVAVLISIPLLVSFFGSAGTSRFSGVGLTADTGPLWRANELRNQHSNPNALPVRLIHNQYLGYMIAFFQNWFAHFQGDFLFISGDEVLRSRIPDAGQMYLFEIPLLAVGIYFLLKKRPENWQVIFLWLGTAPIAAAMTFQAPSALRAHNMIIPLVSISAYGFWQIWLLVKKRAKSLVMISCLLASLIFLWSVTAYLHQYYIHYSKTHPEAWEYGFDELVDFISPRQADYDEIYVTDHYDQPYILFLFYLKYPPREFQKQVELTPRDKFGFSTVRDFGKFHFEKINWQELKKKENVLVVGTAEEIPQSDKIIKEIYYSKANGAKTEKPIFRIAQPDLLNEKN